MTDLLPVIFTVLMGVSILLYVVLDGYDLGVGMLMPAAEREEQDRMVASIGPFWDANETWLVLGVGLLLVAFPAAHGEVLVALYIPVAAMLVGLMLRGVAFELRIKAEGWHRELWNWLFWAGSLPRRVLAGPDARALHHRLRAAASATGCSRWSPARRCAAATCCSARPGSSTAPKARCATRRRRGRAGACCGSRSASRWSASARRWSARRCGRSGFPSPESSFCRSCLWQPSPPGSGCGSRSKSSDIKPFVGSIAIYVLAFAGLAYSLFPYVIIDRMTIWEAAAHESSLKFVLVGAVLVLPFIIGYTIYVYRVFGGKTKAGGDY